MVGVVAEGVARSGFDVDLSFGKSRESAFYEAITDAHVECKSDQKARVTGNVFFEIRQGSADKGEGKLSGIMVTEAKWWAVEYADDCWLTVRTSLAKMLVSRAIERFGTRMGGDRNRYEGVLVPVEWFIAPFKRAA